jgi:HprK-related kinase B
VAPVELVEKLPDPGKTRVKEEYADLPDGRLVRKRLTGMAFIMADQLNLAVGPCLANANQVVNFVNSRYIERLLKRGGLLCHASACARGPGCLVMAGRSGAGKSTLALRLVDHGFDFVSNDRLVLTHDAGGVRVNGVPKLPRVNPGTIVGQEQLRCLMDEEELAEAESLPTPELWRTERKYDVPLETIYGSDCFRLGADLAALIILDWRLDGGPCRIEPFEPAEQPELLKPLTKTPGLFFLPRSTSPARHQDSARLDPGAYARMLVGTPALHVTGGVDFAAAVEVCMELLDRCQSAPAE